MQVTKEQLAIIHSENNQIVNANPSAGKNNNCSSIRKSDILVKKFYC